MQQKQSDKESEVAERLNITTEEARKLLAYESVKDKFTQQSEPIEDCYSERWLECEICGEIKPEPEFWTYGGINRVNLGKCYVCKGR